jgi:hypothetical protein
MTMIRFRWGNGSMRLLTESWSSALSCELMSKSPSHRPRELVAFNRVTNGEFDMDDLRCLHAYTIRILEAITNKYAGQRWRYGPVCITGRA